MTGLVRKATFFVACATVLGAAAAFAGVVSPGNCVVGTGVGVQRINLVGYSGAGAEKADSVSTLAKLQVLVRDVSNNPIAGIPVVLDFSGCTSDVKIGSTQSYHAQTVGCATATIQGFTTTNGTVNFAVIGGRSGATAHPASCAAVYADSYFLGNIRVGTFDENNATGVNGLDISLLGADIFSALNPERSDFNNDTLVNGIDLSLEGGVLFSSRSFVSSSVLCP